MSFFPTRIEQVQAPSNEAMNTYLDLLGKAPNPAKDYGNLIINTMNQYRSADEADKLANAIDILRKGMEAGQSYEDASKGVEARISGSKPFQERADAIRDSVLKDQRFKFDVMNADRSYALEQAGLGLRQREFDLREQELARQLDASDLLAKYYQNRATNGELTSAGFMQDNEGRLENNPYARLMLMEAVNKFQDDLSLASKDDQDIDLTSAFNSANSTMHKLGEQYNNVYRELTNDGKITDNIQAAINSEDVLALGNKLADSYGLSGDNRMRLIKEVATVYNRVGSDRKFRGLHRSQILSAITRHINPDPGWFGSMVDESALRSYLQAHGESGKTLQQTQQALAPYFDKFREDPEFYKNKGAEYQTARNDLLWKLQMGTLDKRNYDIAMSKLNAKYSPYIANANAAASKAGEYSTYLAELAPLSNQPKK